MLPVRHFFTGAPGSRWSGVAQEIEAAGFYDTSDRIPERTYTHGKYSGHVGAYFGTGMEFPALLEPEVLDAPYSGIGTRLRKSSILKFSLGQFKACLLYTSPSPRDS